MLFAVIASQLVRYSPQNSVQVKADMFHGICRIFLSKSDDGQCTSANSHSRKITETLVMFGVGRIFAAPVQVDTRSCR